MKVRIRRRVDNPLWKFLYNIVELFNQDHQLYHFFYDQQVKVRIDEGDEFACDVTLSHIIVPLMEYYKKHKTGAFFVDCEDVPEELRVEDDGELEWDDFNSDRHEWLVDEIIWCMKEINNDEANSPEYPLEKFPFMLDSKETLTEEEKELLDNWYKDYWDYEERLSNGCRLYGKYFRGFWT